MCQLSLHLYLFLYPSVACNYQASNIPLRKNSGFTVCESVVKNHVVNDSGIIQCYQRHLNLNPIITSPIIEINRIQLQPNLPARALTSILTRLCILIIASNSLSPASSISCKYGSGSFLLLILILSFISSLM